MRKISNHQKLWGRWFSLHFGLVMKHFGFLFYVNLDRLHNIRPKDIKPNIKNAETSKAQKAYFRQTIIQIMIKMAEFSEKSNQRQRIVQFIVKQTKIVDQIEHNASERPLFQPLLAYIRSFWFRPNFIFGQILYSSFETIGFLYFQPILFGFFTFGLFYIRPFDIWPFLHSAF